MTKATANELAEALRYVFVSPNESDANGEAANLVDAVASAGRRIGWGLERLAEAVERLGTTQPSTPSRT
jgi:hypothetical protein